MSKVSFAICKPDAGLIRKIVARALIWYNKEGEEAPDRLTLEMDLIAAHLSKPLRLAELFAADNFNFIHDVAGIHCHMDRRTGKLSNHFSPRFSR